MKRAATLFAVLFAVLFGVSLGDAAGPSDKGIQINYGATPLVNPYNGNNAHAVLSANYSPSTVTGNDFASPFRAQIYWQQGGAYDGSSQTAYPVVNAVTTMRGQGQGTGFWHAINGYGKGNANFGGSSVTCWGGGETALPSSTPFCGALGEYDAVQGPLVWGATLTTPISSGVTTLHFTGATNSALGARAVFNINHVYGAIGTISSYTPCTDSSAGACSVTGGTCPRGATSACTVITFAGTTLPTTPADSYYFKTNYTNDYYSPGCGGDDVAIGGKCVGHWYRVHVADTTHLVTYLPFDTINLSQDIGTGNYLMVQGIEATAVDPTNSTITIPSNSLNWANGETIYSPPSHVMGLVGALAVIGKEYLTGDTTALSAGFQVNSTIQPIDAYFQGGGSGGARHGVEIANLQGSDARGLNVDGSFRYGVVLSANDDGSTHTAIATGTSGQCQMGCGLSGTAWTIGGEMVSTQVGIDPDGGGKKLGSFTDSGTLAGLTAKDETVTWTTPFRGTGYIPICVVDDPSKKVQLIATSGKTANVIVATVYNTDASGHANFTVNCFAEWSGN